MAAGRIWGGPRNRWWCWGKLPLPCTVGQFLTQYMLLRIAAACFVALLLWLLLTAINNVKYTIIVAAGVLVAEYSLYTFLPVQSFLNAFKYFNIFTYISLSDFYTNYLNIDLFGFPLGIRSISQLAMLPIGHIADNGLYRHPLPQKASGG